MDRVPGGQPCKSQHLLLTGPFSVPGAEQGGLLGRGKAEGRPGKAGRGSRGPDDTSLSPTCSIHNGVIAVFQRKGLPDQELFSLNEGVR